MNQVNINGRLTREPEVSIAGSGRSYCSFSLANNDKRTSNGEKEVQYFDCKAFGKTADFLKMYVHKGDKVLVTGRLDIDKWSSADGTKRKNVNIIVDRIEPEQSAQRVQEEQLTVNGKTVEWQEPDPLKGLEPDLWDKLPY